MRAKCAFYVQEEHLCNFVTLWVTSFFSYLPRVLYFSSLTFLVSLSCQHIFLSPHTPLSPISSFLISPNTTLFFSFFCRFFLYIYRTRRNCRIFVSCFTVLFRLFNPFSSLLISCGPCPSLFQLYTAGDKTRHKGQEDPAVSVMSFCVVVVAQESVWPC